MQLGRPSVGHGVVESRVESGQIFRHPVKRSRTTLTYLAVAVLGTDEERRLFRRGVDKAHAQVYSTESSPVAYNAFDRDLQLWVAACLYKGVEDTYAAFIGDADPATMASIYQDSATLGTTLQVPRAMWPADREAFQRYWDEAMEQVHIDDTVGAYLHDLIKLRYLPRVLAAPFAPLHRFVTTGFLPARFREELGLTWTPRQQRRFDAAMSVVASVSRRLPKPLRRFPYNALLADLRRRVRAGRPLV
jgi:uncharacterized protein (DUF2236 family)